MPRLYVDADLSEGLSLALPDGAARHAQVLRLQPGDALVLFNGQGGEWSAAVTAMGRRDVTVCVGAFIHANRESPIAVTVAAGMPANERVDWLVEKAAELGASRVQPLTCERSVLRLSADRAERKRDHWQGVAIAACEQSGRTRLLGVGLPITLPTWLGALPPPARDEARWVLLPGAPELNPPGTARAALLLSGPEGGLTGREVALAMAVGFVPAGLGPRVLRAETAPLAALTRLTF